MFKYDVSVIIPTYNDEKYIEECIQSIMKQDYDTNLIQIIIINDGSKDNTKQICEKLASESKNILLINKENSGVSEARNEGLKKAEGKYILFLDADDMLEEHSMKELVRFFNVHYDEIDMVTYPLKFYNDGKKREHYRYELYENGSGIYDLNDYPYLSQTTINTMIKNEKEKVLFDVTLDYSEDESFNTEILMKKKKIGFCKEAAYLYRRNANSVTKTKTNPYYGFETITRYNEGLIIKFKDKEGKVPKYIQAIILNAFRWRIRNDEIFPYHYEKEKFQQAMNRIKHILQYVEVDTIMNMPGMDKYHKLYIINLKESKVSVVLNENGFDAYADDFLVEHAKRIAMRINKFKCRGCQLEILGYVRSVILLYKDFKLFYKTMDKQGNITREEVPVFLSNFSKYKSKMDVTKIYGFDIQIDISSIQRLSFEVEIDKQIFPINYEFSNFVPFNTWFRSFIASKKILSYNKKRRRFVFREATLYRKIATKLKKNAILLKNKRIKAVIYRLCSKIYSKNRIWLYCDRDGVFDNGYYQFMYDISKDDNIQRYYIYDDEFEKIQDEFKGVNKKQLVKYGTVKHKLLYLASSKVLTSFQAMSYYNPLGKNMKCYRDILKYDLIYLQHGILHCHTPWIFSNEKNEIEKVVVSSQYETENFIKNYNYFDRNLIKSGMPRLDFIDVKSEGKNKIVYAPTWRKHLIGDLTADNRRILKKKQFLESDYYKKINALLNSQALIKMLEKRNYIFEFKIHPVFRDYIDLFKTKSKNIIINADSVNLEEYKLFITDYSSYVFDYVYLKRPIIYFLPDEEEFNAGLHIYRKLDLPIEEGFGPITKTAEELVEKINFMIENNLMVEEKYQNRMDNFFINIDNHREKLYNDLRKMRRCIKILRRGKLKCNHLKIMRVRITVTG